MRHSTLLEKKAYAFTTLVQDSSHLSDSEYLAQLARVMPAEMLAPLLNQVAPALPPPPLPLLPTTPPTGRRAADDAGVDLAEAILLSQKLHPAVQPQQAPPPQSQPQRPPPQKQRWCAFEEEPPSPTTHPSPQGLSPALPRVSVTPLTAEVLELQGGQAVQASSARLSRPSSSASLASYGGGGGGAAAAAAAADGGRGALAAQLSRQMQRLARACGAAARARRAERIGQFELKRLCREHLPALPPTANALVNGVLRSCTRDELGDVNPDEFLRHLASHLNEVVVGRF